MPVVARAVVYRTVAPGRTWEAVAEVSGAGDLVIRALLRSVSRSFPIRM